MSLNHFVVDALARDEQFKRRQIWAVDNHEKYSTLDAPRNGSKTTSRNLNLQIFQLMRALNQQGMNQDGLCANLQGQGSLKALIEQLAKGLAELSRNSRIHYIELGPEPIKTTHILGQVKNAGAAIRYTAIDINETSRETMSEAITPLIGTQGSFNYLAADYRQLTHATLRHDQDLTLITMLGFQEGNELPVTTGRLIRNLAGAATYIISEMQVYQEGTESSIHDFYANPGMLRFSELVAQQQGFTPQGEHHCRLLRLKILDELFHVAVTLQPVEYQGQYGHLLTNTCLKYTPEQFRRIRTIHGNCDVIQEFASGDGSVRYQVARYLQ